MMSKNRKTNSASDTRIGTLLGKGAVFDGNFTAPENVRIDGIVNGNFKCEGNVILGTDGAVTGDITAQNVIVSGKVEGDIFAHGKLELLSTGKIQGNITARSLVIDEDACFDGRCTMTTAEDALKKKEESDSQSKQSLEEPEKSEPDKEDTSSDGWEKTDSGDSNHNRDRKNERKKY